MELCKSCRHQRDADLQALVDAGSGDVPLIHLRLQLVNMLAHCAILVSGTVATIAMRIFGSTLARQGAPSAACHRHEHHLAVWQR
jgi:hypothetical protein